MTPICRTPAKAVCILKISKTFPRATASFGTSQFRKKTVAESVKEQAKQVDQAIADKIVDGISAGQNIADKAKEMSGITAKEAKGKAEEVKKQAGDKKEEIKKKI